jgi:plastocyanin
VLGVSTVTQRPHDHLLAIADQTLSTASSTSTASTVRIGNFTFSPAVLEVPAGTSVTWVNDDDAPHAIVGSDRDSPLKSAALDTDDRYAVVMNRPGTYRYFCSLHPHMTGTVVVK